jgi:hypothetical protein
LENENKELKKEKEELKNKLENENNLLQKENEELKNTISNDNKALETAKQRILNDCMPMAVIEFTLEKEEYENENEGKDEIEEKDEIDKIEKIDEIRKNIDSFMTESIRFSIDKNPKESKELSEQGIQIEEIKPEQEEKETDTFDLEKKEIKITSKKILKKTNVLRHEFKHNSICSETQMAINGQNMALIKAKDYSIDKIGPFTLNEKLRYDDESLEIKRTNSIAYRRSKKSDSSSNQNSKDIKESKKIQLLNEKMPKSQGNITGKDEEKNQLSKVKLLKAKKETTDKKNKEDIESVSSKGEDDNKSQGKRRVVSNKELKAAYKKKKLKNVIKKLFNKFDKKLCFNKWNQKDNNLIKEEINDSNIDNINKGNSSISNNNSYIINLNDVSNEMGSSMELTEKSLLDLKNEQEDKEEKEEKEEQPQKKEIKINKKVCIVSKKPKKIKYAEAKQKFLYKAFLVKYWKQWKKQRKEDDIIINESDEMKSLEQKRTRKPFTKRIPIKKRIITDDDICNNAKFLSLKNELMSQNKKLITRQFFHQWKKKAGLDKDKDNKERELGTNIMDTLMRKYITKYLLMHRKILKFKNILIKHILRKHK